MFCPKCGKELAESAKFCENCGAPLEQPPEPGKETLVGQRMMLCEDGVYRWLQKVDLLGNGTHLRLVLLCAAAVALFFFIPMGLDTGLLADDPVMGAAVVLGLTGASALVAALVYSVGAVLIGRRYLLLFELNGEMLYLTRKLSDDQDLRWSAAGLVMGLAVEFPYKMDMMNLMSDHDTGIRLGSVTRIRREPRRGAVCLHGSFGSCRVYVESEDEEELLDFIRAHSPKLKKIS